MSEFTPSKVDQIDLVLCTPAVLCVLFGSHILMALLWGLLFAMLALGRMIWKMLPKPPRIELIAKLPQAEFKLTAHARMSKFQWEQLFKKGVGTDHLWEEIKAIYSLGDKYDKFTKDCWIEHIDFNGEFQPAARRPNDGPEGEVFLYFYTRIKPVEPTAPPIFLEGDDARWARLFADFPLAYWLDPHLWDKVKAEPGEYARAAIGEHKEAITEAFEGAMVIATVAALSNCSHRNGDATSYGWHCNDCGYSEPYRMHG